MSDLFRKNLSFDSRSCKISWIKSEEVHQLIDNKY
jgi:hypothetical protein